MKERSLGSDEGACRTTKKGCGRGGRGWRIGKRGRKSDVFRKRGGCVDGRMENVRARRSPRRVEDDATCSPKLPLSPSSHSSHWLALCVLGLGDVLVSSVAWLACSLLPLRPRRPRRRRRWGKTGRKSRRVVRSRAHVSERSTSVLLPGAPSRPSCPLRSGLSEPRDPSARSAGYTQAQCGSRMSLYSSYIAVCRPSVRVSVVLACVAAVLSAIHHQSLGPPIGTAVPCHPRRCGAFTPYCWTDRRKQTWQTRRNPSLHPPACGASSTDRGCAESLHAHPLSSDVTPGVTGENRHSRDQSRVPFFSFC